MSGRGKSGQSIVKECVRRKLFDRLRVVCSIQWQHIYVGDDDPLCLWYGSWQQQSYTLCLKCCWYVWDWVEKSEMLLMIHQCRRDFVCYQSDDYINLWEEDFPRFDEERDASDVIGIEIACRYDVSYFHLSSLMRFEMRLVVTHTFHWLALMGKLWFWTFGQGHQYGQAVKRLMDQAKRSEMFDECVAFSGSDLQSDEEFWSAHGAFVAANCRGYGYWIWKPWLAKRMFERMADGDIMLYMDAGCEINLTALPKLHDYFQFAEEEGSLFFIQGVACKERFWTKSDTIDRFEMRDTHLIETPQVAATLWFFKKTSANVEFVDRWFSILTSDGYHHVDDSPSVSLALPGFKEHRHDQSVFSLMAKEEGRRGSRDKLWYRNWAQGKSMPLLTCRSRDGRSKLPWKNVKP